MPPTSSRAAYRQGLLAGMPFLLVLVPFALLFGVAATEAGFDLRQTMGFSVLVVAGASQFTAVQMMKTDTPAVIVVLTALAVNLRMAMYSASFAPHLGHVGRGMRAMVAFLLFDQPYALSIQKFEAAPMTTGEKLGYYFGVATPCTVGWWAFTWVGATIGAAIPPAFALDFAVPITFLALVAPMLRTPAHLGAAAVSVAGSLVFAFLPYNLGLIVAGLLAMMAGARIELWQTRRREGAA